MGKWHRLHNDTHLRYIVITLSHVFTLMAPKKTSTLNLRIDPLLKEAAKVAAQIEHRSIANLIEVLIRKHCEEVGIPVPEQQSLFKEGDIDE